MADEIIEQKSQKLANYLLENGGAFSSDYGKRYRDYISVSLHYIADAQFQNLNIGIVRCDPVKKTAPQV